MFKQLIKWFKNPRSILKSNGEGEFSSWITTYSVLLEHIISWNNPFHSIMAVLIVNLVFIFFTLLHLHPLGYIFTLASLIAIADALQLGRMRKYGVFCRAGSPDGRRTCEYMNMFQNWIENKTTDFFSLRQNNPTKAFIVMNCVLCATFVIGQSISLTKLLYILIMLIMVFPLVSPYLKRFEIKTDDIDEIADLLPKICESTINDLNFDYEEPPDQNTIDPLLPKGADQLDGPNISDDDSSSMSNLSGAALLKDIDSSSDDSESADFIPQIPEENKTTVRVLKEAPPPSEGWSDKATSAVWNLGGTLTNLVYATSSLTNQAKGYRRNNSHGDSTDEFEIVEEDEWNK